MLHNWLPGLLIYTIGYIVSAKIYLRYIDRYGTLVIGDLLLTLLFSLGSWVFVLIMLFVYTIDYIFESKILNKPLEDIEWIPKTKNKKLEDKDILVRPVRGTNR